MIVMKFGGTSLGTPERIQRAAQLVVERLGKRPLVVLSALSGVTNALLKAAEDAYQGRVDVMPLIKRHREVCEALGVESELVTPLLLELKDLLKGISLVRELTQRSLDFVASFGERSSVEIFAAYLRKLDKGARAYPAWELGLMTDDEFGSAHPLPEAEALIVSKIQSLPDDVVPIVTGYIAKDRAGEITTLGRNGSDFTATIFGAACEVEEVQIWTDVDGVMTADPGLVPEASSLEMLTYDEAAELAYYGGRVLHPATLSPAMKKDIPVRVLNTMHPEHPGTRIVRQRTPEQSAEAGPVQSIVYKEDQVLIHVTSARMLMQHGYMARVFEILGEHQVVINMIATSEVSISMTTDSMAGLNEAVRDLEEVAEVRIETEKTIVGVVGQGISVSTELPAEILAVVREAGVNVRMVSLGASKVNVTFLIDNAHIPKTIAALHRRFFSSEPVSKQLGS